MQFICAWNYICAWNDISLSFMFNTTTRSLMYIYTLKHDDNFGNASISNIALSAIFIGYLLHLGHCANSLFLLIDCFDIAIIVLFQQIGKTQTKKQFTLIAFLFEFFSRQNKYLLCVLALWKWWKMNIN